VDGFLLVLAASEALTVKVATPADGVCHKDELPTTVPVSMEVPDTVPLTDVQAVTLTLVVELGHTEGETEKRFVAEEVEDTAPVLENAGE